MTNEQKYMALKAELEAIEARTGLYLSCVNVDRENTAPEHTFQDSESFWDEMHFNQKWNAAMRAEEAGYNINELLGKVIY